MFGSTVCKYNNVCVPIGSTGIFLKTLIIVSVCMYVCVVKLWTCIYNKRVLCKSTVHESIESMLSPSPFIWYWRLEICIYHWSLIRFYPFFLFNAFVFVPSPSDKTKYTEKTELLKSRNCNSMIENSRILLMISWNWRKH